MSFVHDIRVGFFGLPEEREPKRDLTIEECLYLFDEFRATAPEFLKIETTSLRGNAESVPIGKCDGRHIGLYRGVLYCPYYSVEYFLASITFAAFVKIRLGCSIYSDDKGDFVTVDELIPTESLSDKFRNYLATHFRATDFD